MNVELIDRLRQITLVTMDVDGVLTDGGIIYGSDGTEQKRFFAADGLGIGLLGASSIRTAIITGRSYPGTERRAAELGIDFCVQGARDKGAAMLEICSTLNVNQKCVLHIGDDWNDIPAFYHAGITAAPSNAVAEVIRLVDIVTNAAGGNGAVREICMMLLAARESVDDTLAKFLQRVSAIAQTIPG